MDFLHSRISAPPLPPFCMHAADLSGPLFYCAHCSFLHCAVCSHPHPTVAFGPGLFPHDGKNVLALWILIDHLAFVMRRLRSALLSGPLPGIDEAYIAMRRNAGSSLGMMMRSQDSSYSQLIEVLISNLILDEMTIYRNIVDLLRGNDARTVKLRLALLGDEWKGLGPVRMKEGTVSYLVHYPKTECITIPGQELKMYCEFRQSLDPDHVLCQYSGHDVQRNCSSYLANPWKNYAEMIHVPELDRKRNIRGCPHVVNMLGNTFVLERGKTTVDAGLILSLLLPSLSAQSHYDKRLYPLAVLRLARSCHIKLFCGFQGRYLLATLFSNNRHKGICGVKVWKYDILDPEAGLKKRTSVVLNVTLRGRDPAWWETPAGYSEIGFEFDFRRRQLHCCTNDTGGTKRISSLALRGEMKAYGGVVRIPLDIKCSDTGFEYDFHTRTIREITHSQDGVIVILSGVYGDKYEMEVNGSVAVKELKERAEQKFFGSLQIRRMISIEPHTNLLARLDESLTDCGLHHGINQVFVWY